MNRKIILGLAICGISACEPLPPDQAHFAKGFDAYQKGDFYAALLYLKPLVEKGHPAAELLMAKMYSNGQGVEVDVGKAEILRNLAAVKIYRNPLPPGVVRPDNATLKSVQDRLDYYTDGAGAAKAASGEDPAKVLNSLDLDAIRRIAITDFENGSSPGPAVTEQAPPVSLPVAKETAPPPAEPETSVAAPSAPLHEIPAQARNSNQISLALLRQSAERNDPLALELLSAAYSKGYYGLTPDRHQASAWREKARLARQFKPSEGSDENNPEENLPVVPILLVCAAGMALIGVGAWFGLKRRAKKA